MTHPFALNRDRRTHFAPIEVTSSAPVPSSPFPVWAPTGSQTGSVSIAVTTQPVAIAPALIILDATSLSGLATANESGTTYAFENHEYSYKWEKISGPDLPAATAPLHMPAFWNDPNVMFQKKAAFSCVTPGSYIFRVTVVDDAGNYATAVTASITVNDPAVVSWSNTFIFADDGDFTGAPTGTQYSTVSALETAVQGASGLTRVRFKKGETVLNFDLGTSSGRMDYTDSWGAGAKPKLRPPEFGTGNMWTWSTNDSSTQVTVTGIDIEGYWDPETETGGQGGGSVLYWRDRNTTVIKHFHDMQIKNCVEVQASCNSAACTIAFTHCDRWGWLDYGFLCLNNNDGAYIFLWCSSRQAKTALSGIDGPKQNIANQHGPWRIKEALLVIIHGCYGYSRNGWSGANAQPVLRCSTGDATSNNLGAEYFVTCCFFEGGYQIINGEGENSSAFDNPGNYKFLNMILLGSATNNADLVSWHKGGATFENILIIAPNVPDQQSTVPLRFFNFAPNNNQNGNAGEPVRLRNCTCIDLRNDTNGPSGIAAISSASSFTNFAEENCVRLGPNFGPPVASHTNMDLTDMAGVAAEFPGVKYNYLHVSGSGTVGNGSSFTIAWASLAAVDAKGDGPGTVPTQGTWSANGKANLNYDGTMFYEDNGDFTLTATADGLQVTNTSGGSWSGTYYFQADRSNVIDSQLPLQTSFATQDLIPLGRQQADSSAINPGGVEVYSITDFLGGLRGASPDAGAWQGVAA